MIFAHRQNGLLPIYRYWNMGSDHFYTSKADEIGTTTVGEKGKHGYECEGILGYLSPTAFAGSVPVYRYFNRLTGDHFYTVSPTEIGSTNLGEIGNHSYIYEGILGYAYPPEHNVAPVYRYCHEKNKEHLYTTWPVEIGTVTHGATGKHGYKSEGVNFYVFLHHAEGLLPIYRYFNGKDHFYTANADEIGTTKIGEAGKGGYVHEGIMGFVSPNQFNGSIPIYRYFHPVSGDHFYTTLATEIGTTHEGQVGALGFKCEGILGYVPSH